WTQMRRGPGSAKFMASSSMIASRSGGRADANRVQVEPRAAEVAAEPDRPGVDEVDHGGHDLGFARRAVGNGLHQIEQRQLECHCPARPFSAANRSKFGAIALGWLALSPDSRFQVPWPVHLHHWRSIRMNSVRRRAPGGGTSR